MIHVKSFHHGTKHLYALHALSGDPVNQGKLKHMHLKSIYWVTALTVGLVVSNTKQSTFRGGTFLPLS